jgi:hypothetical protein
MHVQKANAVALASTSTEMLRKPPASKAMNDRMMDHGCSAHVTSGRIPAHSLKEKHLANLENMQEPRACQAGYMNLNKILRTEFQKHFCHAHLELLTIVTVVFTLSVIIRMKASTATLAQ